MNKKGIYLPTLVALTAFLLAYATFAVLTTNTSIAGEAGKNQIDIIQLYQKGEFIRQYIKQSARNSINDALNEFGKNGGLRKEGCKSENEFVWNNECKPNKEDYLLYFDNNFKNYLNLNNKIPKLDFDYTIQENNLIAKSKNSKITNSAEKPYVGKTSKSLFVPYWSLNSELQLNSYDRVFYFGISVNEFDINKEEDGYKNLKEFSSISLNKKRKYLTLRMTNTEDNLKILKEFLHFAI